MECWVMGISIFPLGYLRRSRQKISGKREVFCNYSQSSTTVREVAGSQRGRVATEHYCPAYQLALRTARCQHLRTAADNDHCSGHKQIHVLNYTLYSYFYREVTPPTSKSYSQHDKMIMNVPMDHILFTRSAIIQLWMTKMRHRLYLSIAKSIHHR